MGEKINAQQTKPAVKPAPVKSSMNSAPLAKPAEKKEALESEAVSPVSQPSPENSAPSEKVEAKPAKKIEKKEEAVANGSGIAASKKHCIYIGNFIKGKSIDQAIHELEAVVKLKRAIPYKGEIPHRRGAMMSGRYPVNASKIIINMLKGLKGNAIVNGLDIDKTRIYYCSATWAARQARGGGERFKRTNITLKAKEITTGDKK